jgi:hypothetical protein
MRWVIACVVASFGCRSTHVSELPLVHDIRPLPNGGLVVESCTLRFEHVKDYTLWPLLLIGDVFIALGNGHDDFGLSIESFNATDTGCVPDVVGGPP